MGTVGVQCVSSLHQNQLAFQPHAWCRWPRLRVVMWKRLCSCSVPVRRRSRLLRNNHSTPPSPACRGPRTYLPKTPAKRALHDSANWHPAVQNGAPAGAQCRAEAPWPHRHAPRVRQACTTRTAARRTRSAVLQTERRRRAPQRHPRRRRRARLGPCRSRGRRHTFLRRGAC